jgi:hypothetical protein
VRKNVKKLMQQSLKVIGQGSALAGDLYFSPALIASPFVPGLLHVVSRGINRP